MPVVKLETNTRIPEEKAGKLRQGLLAAVAGATGVPTADFRVELAGDRKMRMADSDEPIAHVEIKDLDLPKDQAPKLTQAVCPVLDGMLGIRDNRVYIAVISTRSSMWRVNGNVS